MFLTRKISGGYAEGATPVPIPNTEVKPLWADDTARVAAWESRSPPELITQKPRLINSDGAFVVCINKNNVNQCVSDLRSSRNMASDTVSCCVRKLKQTDGNGAVTVSRRSVEGVISVVLNECKPMPGNMGTEAAL